LEREHPPGNATAVLKDKLFFKNWRRESTARCGLAVDD
jgi:hypothetical protein